MSKDNCCEKCYTSPDKFSPKTCLDAVCHCHPPTEVKEWEESYKESVGIIVSEILEDRFGIVGKHVAGEDIPDYALTPVRDILTRHSEEIVKGIEGMMEECPNHEEPGVKCYGYTEDRNQTLTDAIALVRSKK